MDNVDKARRSRLVGLRGIRSAFVCLVLGGIVWLALPREPALIDRSTRLVEMNTGQPVEDGGEFCWLSNDEALYIRPDRNAAGVLCWRSSRVNVRTGAQVRLGSLDALLARLVPKPTFPGDAMFGSEVSPDGRWLLNGWRGRLRALPLIAGKPVQWRNLATYATTWLPHSNGWLSFVSSNVAEAKRNAESGYLANPGRLLTLNLTHLHLEDAHAIRALPNDRCVAVVGKWATAHKVDCLELTMHDPISILRRSTIQFPSGWRLGRAALSPQGDRVSFILTEDQEPVGVWRRFESWIGLNSSYAARVWVARTDGTDMHELGYVTGTCRADLQWTPDGKRIGYRYRGWLWTVPVD